MSTPVKKMKPNDEIGMDVLRQTQGLLECLESRWQDECGHESFDDYAEVIRRKVHSIDGVTFVCLHPGVKGFSWDYLDGYRREVRFYSDDEGIGVEVVRKSKALTKTVMRENAKKLPYRSAPGSWRNVEIRPLSECGASR